MQTLENSQLVLWCLDDDDDDERWVQIYKLNRDHDKLKRVGFKDFMVLWTQDFNSFNDFMVWWF